MPSLWRLGLCGDEGPESFIRFKGVLGFSGSLQDLSFGACKGSAFKAAALNSRRNP